MGKLKYLVIHCSATPATMIVTKGMLEEWHKGPRDVEPGKVEYLEKFYPSREALPDEFINGKPIEKLHGRGWARIGYSILIHRSGVKEIVTPFNDDDVITNDEMTWGATGINSVSRHICLEGGGTDDKIEPKFSTLFTPFQLATLLDIIDDEIGKCPTLIIAGHNNFASKSCPNFDVHQFMINNDMEENSYEPKK
jgi:hypothetical protein